VEGQQELLELEALVQLVSVRAAQQAQLALLVQAD
jgi:hypothetical protein